MLVNIMSNENLQCANRKQCQNDKAPGQQVLKKRASN
jgi:hypothetical protein